MAAASRRTCAGGRLMQRRSITPKLTALGAKVAKLAGGRLLVSSPEVATVFREDGTKDPVQPVRSNLNPEPKDS
jgi:hypothetical protein